MVSRQGRVAIGLASREFFMSAENPIEELDEIISLCEAGKLPAKAVEWAEGALETAEGILDTIDSMQADGRDAPTDEQASALENIYIAARKWLDRL